MQDRVVSRIESDLRHNCSTACDVAILDSKNDEVSPKAAKTMFSPALGDSPPAMLIAYQVFGW